MPPKRNGSRRLIKDPARRARVLAGLKFVGERFAPRLTKRISQAVQLGRAIHKALPPRSANPEYKTVMAPLNTGRVARGGIATQTNIPGGVRVVHRELVLNYDIYNGANDATFGMSINPGLATIFPWLSNVAMQYQTYVFNSLSFTYEPNCPTTTAGQFLMALDFNVQDARPTNYPELISLATSTATPFWVKTTLGANQSDLHKMKQKFIRTGNPATGQDINTTDVANFYYGNPAVLTAYSSVGYVWVSYSVDLFTPQYNVLAQVSAQNATVVTNGGVSLANPFGSIATPPVLGGGLQVTASLNTLTIARYGYYLLVWKITGVGLIADSFPTLVTTNPIGIFGASIKINAAATVGVMFGVFRNSMHTNYTFDFTGCAVSISDVTLHISPHSTVL